MKLEINGKEYGLLWGLGAFEICCDTLDITLADIDFGIASSNQKILFNLAYAAMKNYADVNETEVDISYRKFQAWLDEADSEIGVKIVNDYLDSKYLGKTMREHYAALSGGDIDKDQSKKKPKRSPSAKR